MANYMPYPQMRTTSPGSHLKNRLIFTGSQTNTSWPVPEGTTEVWVHVWGGGGGARGNVDCGAGGGGGGYARAAVVVTDSDTLSITVGGNGGTSSISSPTIPGLSVSATGGASAVGLATGGLGGSGSVTLSPTNPTYYCFNAPGGQGGSPSGQLGNNGCQFSGQSGPSGACYVSCGQYTYGAGGAAGSPLGRGGNGSTGTPAPPYNRNCVAHGPISGGSGGGIGGSDGSFNYQVITMPLTPCGMLCQTTNSYGGSALQTNMSFQNVCSSGPFGCVDPATAPGQYFPTNPCNAITGVVGVYNVRAGTVLPPLNPSSPCCAGTTYSDTQCVTSLGDDWYYVEDIAGSTVGTSLNGPTYISAGAGAGGVGNISPYSDPAKEQSRGGFLGGGGAFRNTDGGSPGGCGGGSGSGSSPSPTICCIVSGTPGAVILYW